MTAHHHIHADRPFLGRRGEHHRSHHRDERRPRSAEHRGRGPGRGRGSGPASDPAGCPSWADLAPRGGARSGPPSWPCLLEAPMHGYQIITELSERSGGDWRPSAGSVYPTLQQLTDEGLVRDEERDGRRVYELTESGRAEAERITLGGAAVAEPRTGTAARTCDASRSRSCRPRCRSCGTATGHAGAGVRAAGRVPPLALPAAGRRRHRAGG